MVMVKSMFDLLKGHTKLLALCHLPCTNNGKTTGRLRGPREQHV